MREATQLKLVRLGESLGVQVRAVTYAKKFSILVGKPGTSKGFSLSKEASRYIRRLAKSLG
jgi:hypothetical protein